MNVALLLILGFVLVAAAWRWSMRGLSEASHVALVAVLGVTASAFNVVVPIASVEATTTVVLCTAIALGLRMGIAVAVVAVIGSSVAGGLGPWTIWQVAGWSITSVAGAGLGLRVRELDWYRPYPAALLGAVAAICTLVYDVVVTVPSAMTFGGDIMAALLLGAAFTVTHVVFTTVATVIAGPSLLHALNRARPRLDGGAIRPASGTSPPRVGPSVLSATVQRR